MVKHSRNSNFRVLELLFVLFLVSGFIKSLLIGNGIFVPIDLTLVFGIILSFYLIFSDKVFTNFYVLIPIIVFFVWSILTATYTSSEGYWSSKLINFLTNILALSIPVLIKNFHKEVFLKYFIILTSFLNLYFIVFILPYIYQNSLFYEISGNYLTVSLLSGVNILLILINEKFSSTLGLKVSFLILNFITLIGSGGRGGVVFTIFVVFAYFLIKTLRNRSGFLFQINSKRVIMSGLFFLIFYFTVLNNSSIYSDLESRSLNRLSTFLELSNKEGRGKSINERVDLIDFSEKKITAGYTHFIFGYGIGSFLYEYKGVDGRGYPHNIVLEVTFEMGLIGLTILLIFFVVSNRYYKYTSLTWLTIYFFLHAMKSSELSDLRIAFAFMAITFLDGKINKGKKFEIQNISSFNEDMQNKI